jgi:hypothetical protein
VIGAGAFNFVKFMLSIFAIFFDSIFLFQHYVLYSDAWKNPKKLEKFTEGKTEEQTIDDQLLVNKSN